MEKLKIQVTKSDIERGVKYSGDLCPIGTSIRRIACTEDVIVTPRNFYIDGKRRRTTKKMKEFILAFDSGQPVKPFTIYVNPPN